MWTRIAQLAQVPANVRLVRQGITTLQAAPHVLHARISPIVWSVAMEVHAHLAVVVIMLALARALLAVM